MKVYLVIFQIVALVMSATNPTYATEPATSLEAPQERPAESRQKCQFTFGWLGDSTPTLLGNFLTNEEYDFLIDNSELFELVKCSGHCDDCAGHSYCKETEVVFTKPKTGEKESLGWLCQCEDKWSRGQ
ncbi:MAG: hypothetical protein KDD55_00415 [Bdellovibrionales bacterium]|nr:hypothetical protein [Bdellovibrionales bacterium]